MTDSRIIELARVAYHAQKARNDLKVTRASMALCRALDALHESENSELAALLMDGEPAEKGRG